MALSRMGSQHLARARVATSGRGKLKGGKGKGGGIGRGGRGGSGGAPPGGGAPAPLVQEYLLQADIEAYVSNVNFTDGSDINTESGVDLCGTGGLEVYDKKGGTCTLRSGTWPNDIPPLDYIQITGITYGEGAGGYIDVTGRTREIGLMCKGDCRAQYSTGSHQSMRWGWFEDDVMAINDRQCWNLVNLEARTQEDTATHLAYHSTYVHRKFQTFAIVLGGYNASSEPWVAGSSRDDYTYGAAFFYKGFTSGTWQLGWKDDAVNTATVYFGMQGHTNTSYPGWRNQIVSTPDDDLMLTFDSLHFDKCTDTNGTALTAHSSTVGGGWTHQTGTFQIQSNTIQPNSGADEDVATVDVSTTDVLIEAKITNYATDASNLDKIGIVTRYTDSNNYWVCVFNPADDTLKIFENVSGTLTERASTGHTVASGTEYKLTVVVSGNDISAYVGAVGSEVSQTTYNSSANNTMTEHGLFYGVAGTSPGTAKVSQFVVFPTGKGDEFDHLDTFSATV